MWRNPLHWSLLKSNRKSFIRCIQSFIRLKHLLRRMFIKTQHGNPRNLTPWQSYRNPLRNRHQNRCSFIQNRSSCFSRSNLLIWRIIRRRSFLKLKRHEQIRRYQKTLGLNFLLRKSLIKLRRKNLGRKKRKRRSCLKSLNRKSLS